MNLRFLHYTGRLIGVFLLSALYGCNESEDPQNADSPVRISYRINTGWNNIQSNTRGLAFDNTESFTTEGRTFRVTAWMEKTGYAWEPLVSNSNPNALNDVDVSYQGATIGWSADNPYFWPDMEYQAYFYARYPSNVPFNGTDKTIVYNSTTPIDGNTDMMYATYRGGYLFNEGGGVPVSLDFHHALSCVQFMAVRSGELTVTVNSLEICNVRSQGTFTYPAALTGDDYGDFGTGSWSGVTGYANYSLNNNSLVLTTTPQLLTSETYGSSLMFVPQTTTAWNNTANTIAANDGSTGPKGTYLKIGCSVVFGGHTYNDAGYVYCPISLNLTAGTKTIYTIGFGVGYDSNGIKLLQSIVLSTQVVDWTVGGSESPTNVYIN